MQQKQHQDPIQCLSPAVVFLGISPDYGSTTWGCNISAYSLDLFLHNSVNFMMPEVIMFVAWQKLHEHYGKGGMTAEDLPSKLFLRDRFH